MKYFIKYLNLKFLTLLVIIDLIYTSLELYFPPEVIKIIPSYDLTLYSIIASILIAPLVEEVLFRYWAYGKNLILQFVVFLVFIIDFSSDLIFHFKIINNNNLLKFHNNSLFWYTLLIFITFFLYFVFKKINLLVPKWFTKFINSNYTFIFIILIFEFIHYFEYDNYWAFMISIFVSYIITRQARDYGVYYSILMHAVYNLWSVLGEVLYSRSFSKKLFPDQNLFLYIIMTICLSIYYSYKIIKAKPISGKNEFKN